jgi:hypothetical protein
LRIGLISNERLAIFPQQNAFARNRAKALIKKTKNKKQKTKKASSRAANENVSIYFP